jgi:fucose permease
MTSEAQAQAHADIAQAVQSRQRTQIGLAFFSFILIGANDGGLGVLLPSMSAYYGIGKGTAGLLFPAGALGYLAAAFSSGLLLERFGRRALLALGGLVLGVGALAVFSKPPFPVLLPSLLCVGFGVAVLDAGLNAYIAGLPRSTGLLNFLHAFYGAGALLGPVIASAILALSWSWSVTYLIWAGTAIVVVIGFATLFEPREAPAHHGAQGSGNVLGDALRVPVVWLCAVFLLVYVGTEVSLGSWSYSLLTQERHQMALYAAWMVSGYWLGLTLGRIALGRVGDRLGSRRLINLCLAGVVVGVLLVWVAPIGAVAALGLWLTGFSLGPIFPTTIAVISELVAPRLQQSAIGFAASLGSMGAAAFPWIAGNLAQHLGLWTLLPFVVVLTAGMLVLWLRLQRSNQQAVAR